MPPYIDWRLHLGHTKTLNQNFLIEKLKPKKFSFLKGPVNNIFLHLSLSLSLFGIFVYYKAWKKRMLCFLVFILYCFLFFVAKKKKVIRLTIQINVTLIKIPGISFTNHNTCVCWKAVNDICDFLFCLQR